MPLLRVHGQPIAPEVQAFRAQWYESDEKARELRRRIKEIPQRYDEISPDDLVPIRPGLAEVNLAPYNLQWEDADTLLLNSPWYKFWRDPVAIRLTGIDAPEIEHPGDPTNWFRFNQAQPHGQASLRAVEEFTTGKNVRVFVGTGENQKTYGRYLGVVAAGEDVVNIEAVRRGWAAALPWGEAGSDILSREELIRLEKQAYRERQGMWQEPFFQKYLDVARGLGGRLTFNTLTDLSRLSRNYHLAAVESYLSNPDATRSPALGKWLGKKLIPSYGRFFSAHNSNYNTIEGMRHGGWAGSMRPHNTDFGSGLTTEMFGSLKAFMQASKQSVRSKLKKISSNVPETLGDFMAGGGGAQIFIKPRGVFGRIFSKEPSITGRIVFDPKLMREELKETLGDKFGQYSEETVQDVLSILKFHEKAEIHYGTKIARHRKMQSTKELTDYLEENRFGSHFSPGIIVEEMLMGMKLGDESYRMLRDFRLGEVASLEKIIQNPASMDQSRAIQNYVSRVRKIIGTLDVRYAPRFSANHGAYNVIPGMQHQGMSARMRKVGTDFGSRSDPLRAIARGMGIMFEDLLKLPEWKAAVKGAEALEVLGKGSFGQATLYKTMFKGQEVQFVKKTLHEDTGELVELLLKQHQAGGRSAFRFPVTEEQIRGMGDLAYEARAYHALGGETELVPSLYGMRGTDKSQELLMEAMPGISIADWAELAEHKIVPKHVRQQLAETLQVAEQKGIFNPDIHSGNILYDIETKRAAWIDWGAAMFDKQANLAQKARQKQAFENIPGLFRSHASIERAGNLAKGLVPAERSVKSEIDQESVKSVVESEIDQESVKSVVERPVSPSRDPRRGSYKTPNVDSVQLAAMLKDSKKVVWDAARNGGKRHVIAPREGVKHVSVYADTLPRGPGGTMIGY